MTSGERKAIYYTTQQRSMYIGRVESVLRKAAPSPVLLVSLEEDLEVISPGGNDTFRSRSLLIPSGTEVHINTRGSKVAQCFLDDLGLDFARLIPQMRASVAMPAGRQVYSGIRCERDIIQHADFLLDSRPSNEDAFALFDELIGKLAVDSSMIPDPRIARAVNMIKANYTENLSVNNVAVAVGLSVPRLSQLFKQMVGMPIRRFRLWYRVFATAAKVGHGYSLTEAAIACGFSDYPQLCRVFKELTGARPAEARANTEVRVSAGCF